MLRQARRRRTEGSTARSVQPSPTSGAPLGRPARTAPADRAPGQVSRPSRRIVKAGITPYQPLAVGHSDRVSGAKAQFKTMFPVKPAASMVCCRGRLAERGAGCRTHPQHPRARHRQPSGRLRWVPFSPLLARPGSGSSPRPGSLVGDSGPAVSGPVRPVPGVPPHPGLAPISPATVRYGAPGRRGAPGQDSCLSGPLARLVHASAAIRPDSRRPLAHIPLAAAVNFVPLPRVTRTIRAVPCRMETI